MYDEESFKGRVAEFIANEKRLQKKDYTFINEEDRSLFDKVEYDSVLSVDVKNKQGEKVTLIFCVCSIMDFPHERWVYGHLLSPKYDDPWYRRVEFRISDYGPGCDTIEEWVSAPPLGYKEKDIELDH